jgi:hypothetical protein
MTRTVIYANANIAIWQAIMIAIQTNSNRENADIHALVEKIEKLEKSLSHWETGLIILIAITAVAAVGIFVAEFGSRKMSKKLQAAQADLIVAKDQQLAANLQSHGSQIGKLGDEAAQTKREYDEKMLVLQTDAANAKAAQQKVEIDLAKQQERAATAETELLKLKERIKDRHLTLKQQETVAAKLKAFAGQKINVVTFGGDEEIVGIAKDITAALGSPDGAQWDITTISGVAPTGTAGGILIEVAPKANDSTGKVAFALVTALRAEHLAVTGPEVAAHGQTFFGGKAKGPIVIEDNRLGGNSAIVMTIAKKP